MAKMYLKEMNSDKTIEFKEVLNKEYIRGLNSQSDYDADVIENYFHLYRLKNTLSTQNTMHSNFYL